MEYPTSIFATTARSTLCQCAQPDRVVTDIGDFCATCGGDLLFEPDPMQDIADAKLCRKFGCGL